MKIPHYALCCAIGLAAACNAKKPPLPLAYQGPMKEVDGMETVYVEDQMIKLKLRAERVFEFQNGDQEFPDGINIEFYEDGKKTSVMKANKAYFFKKEKMWRGQGNVRVDNIKSEQKIRTEELFWKEQEKRIFTKKFITIRLRDELIYGTGLDAAQDLSEYTIKSPGGEFELDD